jgi:hypothetical protein
MTRSRTTTARREPLRESERLLQPQGVSGLNLAEERLYSRTFLNDAYEKANTRNRKYTRRSKRETQRKGRALEGGTATATATTRHLVASFSWVLINIAVLETSLGVADSTSSSGSQSEQTMTQKRANCSPATSRTDGSVACGPQLPNSAPSPVGGGQRV